MPKRNDKDKNTKSRMESLSDSHPAKCVPPVNSHYASAFDDVGKFSLLSMGEIAPIAWVEIDSFCNRSSYDLNEWESEQIHLMSVAFCNMHRKAKKSNCRAPYQKNIRNDKGAIQALLNEADRQLDAFFK